MLTKGLAVVFQPDPMQHLYGVTPLYTIGNEVHIS
jgi:hypothetical protein